MLKFILLLLISCNTFATINFETKCINDTDGGQGVVDVDYMSCVNRNFVKGRFYFDLDRNTMPRCFNQDYGAIDMRFIDCINDNLQLLGELAKVRITYCPNFSTEQLQQTFVNCVNGRFEKLQNALNQ